MPALKTRFALGALLSMIATGAALASSPPVHSIANGDREVDSQTQYVPARLVEASRPAFPRGLSRPELVLYPGMPAAERPAPDWVPERGIWTLKVRVELDPAGLPVEARIEDNPLRSHGMVRRYERLALRAVKAWRYLPAQFEGRAVASDAIMAFHFDTALGQPVQAGYAGAIPPNRAFPLTNWRGNWRLTNR